MKPSEMGKEAHLFQLSGEKTRRNHLDESLAGILGGKDVGTPIKPILQLLQTRYVEALSLDELASAGSVSNAYCCELFQVALNTTPITYRNGLRLAEARRLMQTTDLTIHDIAYRVGFQSVREFNRLFRRNTGCSPSQFRAQL